eukprot:TRINITY_DN44797_c0_g1_i1.p1 TRINITY_DN44797_c0_g1~~TRINITY_DN44797_c0_g1_i1.p1  ORF type:complete len:248 (-),score=27.09 TRINITY_DN44797_c0_g1_i1:392-1135(-)
MSMRYLTSTPNLSSLQQQPLRVNTNSRIYKKLPRTRLQAFAVATQEEGVQSKQEYTFDDALVTLKTAVNDPSVSPQQMLKAFMTLEKKKPDAEGFFTFIGGSENSGGNRWRLIFVSSKEDFENARKGKPTKGGYYFPLTASQKFDATSLRYTNGVYLGHIANLEFTGPISWQGRSLIFDVDRVQFKLGPFQFGFNQNVEEAKKKYKVQPKFLFTYADEDIIVAKGAQGGSAVWGRTTKAWEVENGIV